MRYGETWSQRFAREKQELEIERANRKIWRRKFAFFPVKIDGGLHVWLEPYEEQERYSEGYGWIAPYWYKSRRLVE
jgi:hypothetical protein